LWYVSSTDTKTVTYATYQDCYTKVLAPASKSGTGDASKAAKAMETFIQGGGFDFLREFETKYKCAGFCKPPLFYATKSVSDRPT